MHHSGRRVRNCKHGDRRDGLGAAGAVSPQDSRFDRTATSCARPNLVTEAVERGLCGEGVSEETLEPLPEVLRTGTETLIAALKDATAVARA